MKVSPTHDRNEAVTLLQFVAHTPEDAELLSSFHDWLTASKSAKVPAATLELIRAALEAEKRANETVKNKPVYPR